MSTHVSRYIEVKNKNGKWELLRFYYPFTSNYYKPDIILDGKEYNEFNCTCDNACYLREFLGSRGWTWKDHGLGDRGFPTDMSDELKEYFKKEFETPRDGETKCYDYRYNKSYVYLDELYNVYKKEKKEWTDRFLKRLKEHEYDMFHKKLDRLLQVSSIMMDNLTDDEKEKEKKTTDRLLKTSKKQNNEDDFYSFQEEMEEFDELFREIESIKNEYIYTWRLVDEIYGYKEDNEIRIVYYFT